MKKRSSRVVSLIAAVAENNVIGREGGLPWRIPEDFEYYWRKVTGQIIVLGRHCFHEADHPAALAIVLSHDPAFRPPPIKSGGRRCLVARSLTEGLALAQEFRFDDDDERPVAADEERATSDDDAVKQAADKEIFVCGGPRVFEEAMPIASRLYLTHVHANVPGDTFFPHNWREYFPRMVSERPSKDANYRYTFCVYEK